jgi:hypothetical protein
VRGFEGDTGYVLALLVRGFEGDTGYMLALLVRGFEGDTGYVLSPLRELRVIGSCGHTVNTKLNLVYLMELVTLFINGCSVGGSQESDQSDQPCLMRRQSENSLPTPSLAFCTPNNLCS